MMLFHHPILTPVLAAILGAILGSFIAALAARWPEGQSVASGRSHCEACGKTLGAAELIPILSYIAQHGRCRNCGATIDRDALAIELIAAIIGGVSVIALPGWPGLVAAIFGWLLLPLAWLDLRHFWLPRRLTLALALTGVLVALTGLGATLVDRMIGAGSGFLSLWLISAGYRALRQRDGLGEGDPLLLGSIGLWLGWQALPFVLLIASGLGLGAALLLITRGREMASDTRFPLGTLLALGAWAVMLLMPGLS